MTLSGPYEDTSGRNMASSLVTLQSRIAFASGVVLACSEHLGTNLGLVGFLSIVACMAA